MPFKITQRIFSTSVYFFVMLLPLTSCNQNKKQHSDTKKADTLKNLTQAVNVDNKLTDTSTTSNALEHKVIDTIFKLKEVKERQKYIEQKTKGVRHLQILIAGKPNLTNKYYWVQVVEDNGISFVTHFNFFVYPDSMRIMYLDTQDDKEITLKKWRKTNGM